MWIFIESRFVEIENGFVEISRNSHIRKYFSEYILLTDTYGEPHANAFLTMPCGGAFSISSTSACSASSEANSAASSDSSCVVAGWQRMDEERIAGCSADRRCRERSELEGVMPPSRYERLKSNIALPRECFAMFGHVWIWGAAPNTYDLPGGQALTCNGRCDM